MMLLKALLFALLVCLVAGARRRTRPTAPAAGPPPPPPQINWGKCPQLNPTQAERQAKAAIIQGCLKQIPLPKKVDKAALEQHRAQVAGCALAAEKWFTRSGAYRFKKAQREIRAKRLPADIEPKILAHHKDCKKEATSKFSNREQIISQIQLYQACMDYNISQTCEIVIPKPPQAPKPRRAGRRRNRGGNRRRARA